MVKTHVYVKCNNTPKILKIGSRRNQFDKWSRHVKNARYSVLMSEFIMCGVKAFGITWTLTRSIPMRSSNAIILKQYTENRVQKSI